MFKSWYKKLEQKIVDISDEEYHATLLNFRWILIGVSWIYKCIVLFRLFLYSKGIFVRKRLPCFIISIGNIMAGGTGKTPMAIYLANLLEEMGKSVVVVSRGYKGQYHGEYGIVTDGRKLFLNSEDSGDEPFMMAGRKSFPVVVGKNRYLAGNAAIKRFKPDVIILDDGFQHIQLKRDMDILLFDSIRPLGNNRLLPAGRLRESIEKLNRKIDAMVFTRCNDQKHGQSLGKRFDKFASIPHFDTQHSEFIHKVISSNDGHLEKLSSLNGTNTILFSGLANNTVFHDSIQKFNANILHHLEFNDHHGYNQTDFYKINDMAKQLNAEFILTTEKDFVKIDRLYNWCVPLVVVGIRIEFKRPEKFKQFIGTALASRGQRLDEFRSSI